MRFLGGLLQGGGPVAAVVVVEPAPDLGIAIEGEDVVADQLVVVPDPLFLLVADPRRGAVLLAEVEALAVADDQVSLDDAIGR